MNLRCESTRRFVPTTPKTNFVGGLSCAGRDLERQRSADGRSDGSRRRADDRAGRSRRVDDVTLPTPKPLAVSAARASSSDRPLSCGTTLIAELRELTLPAVSVSTIEKERDSFGSKAPTVYSSSVGPRLLIGWSSAKSTKPAISLPG